MKNILYLAVLITIGSPAYGQFNTIRQVKILPQIQVDTAAAQLKKESRLPAFGPPDSAAFKHAARKIGNLVSMPLSNPVITSYYGKRIDPLTGKVKFHQGLDFRALSDSVRAIMPGKVRKVAYSRGLGNYIEVGHGDYRSIYGHLSFIMVNEKMEIAAGTVIGITGTTGRSAGEHLHFAMKHKGSLVNPGPFLELIYRTVKFKSGKKAKELSTH